MSRKSWKKSQGETKPLMKPCEITGIHYVDLIEMAKNEQSQYAKNSLKKIIQENSDIVFRSFSEIKKINPENLSLQKLKEIINMFDIFFNSLYNLRVLNDYSNLYQYLVGWKNHMSDIQRLEWIFNKLNEIEKEMKNFEELEKKKEEKKKKKEKDQKKENNNEIKLSIQFNGIPYSCVLNLNENDSPINTPKAE